MTNIRLRDLFLDHVAQTSEYPSLLEIEYAEGVMLYDTSGKKYYDMNSGISVSALGHRHPNIVNAIKAQLDKYMHTMVYGEHVQSPQVLYAKLLTDLLPSNLNCVYYANSGSEAIEIALKLAKRVNSRFEIISAANAYHGSTQGAECLRSDHEYSRAFMPLIPGFKHIRFNDLHDLDKINVDTSAVVIELVQAEAGIQLPDPDFLHKLKIKCEENKVLLIIDEIQTGFGRTGELFAFQKYGVIPDILVIGKGMGGGMPIAAVVSSKQLLSHFTKNPSLGHITTFGGHPVVTASAKATLETIMQSNVLGEINKKEKLIHSILKHKIIKEIRSSGLMMAVELTRRKFLKHVVNYCLQNGCIIDYFLFNDRSFRLYPPLIIKENELMEACQIIIEALDYAESKYN